MRTPTSHPATYSHLHTILYEAHRALLAFHLQDKSYFSLPDFPSFPSEPDAFIEVPALPIPRLLPRSPQLEGSQFGQTHAQGVDFGVALGVGAAAGAAAAGVVAIFVSRLRRRGVSCPGRVALQRRKPPAADEPPNQGRSEASPVFSA